MRLKLFTFVCIIGVFLLTLNTVSFADTITFESKPDGTPLSAGDKLFGDEWQGVVFLPEDNLYIGRSYLDASLENCLGGSPNFDDQITIQFDAGVTTEVSFYLINPVPSVGTITAEALDLGENVVGSIQSDGTSQAQPVTFPSAHKVRIFASTGQFAVDDVSSPAISTVPLPGALWLLGSGLVGLVAFRGRRQR
jgi:hypothetical protein